MRPDFDAVVVAYIMLRKWGCIVLGYILWIQLMGYWINYMFMASWTWVAVADIRFSFGIQFQTSKMSLETVKWGVSTLNLFRWFLHLVRQNAVHFLNTLSSQKHFLSIFSPTFGEILKTCWSLFNCLKKIPAVTGIVNMGVNIMKSLVSSQPFPDISYPLVIAWEIGIKYGVSGPYPLW